MKAIMLAAIVLMAIKGQGQISTYESNPFAFPKFTDYKEFKDSTGAYLVKYNVNSESCYVPATVGGQPHYNAMIEVYRIVDCRCFTKQTDSVLVGKTIKGIYVREGCYEDAPAEWVKNAKRLELEATQITPQRKINE